MTDPVPGPGRPDAPESEALWGMTTNQWIITWLSLLFAPYVIFLSCVIVLAAFGKTVGVRKLYINILLYVFEWGKQRIESHDRAHSDSFDEGSDHDKLGNGNAVAVRENSPSYERQKTVEEISQGFQLADTMFFCKKGIETIVEDEITQRFDAAEISSWNLLTRTNTSLEFISLRLTTLWIIGFILRYIILLPFRAVLALFAIGLITTGTTVIGYLPVSKNWRRILNFHLTTTCYRVMSRAFSAVITFHNKENRAHGGGICVANHTSPIDICILGCDNCYAMVGQAQGGLMGVMQRAMHRAEHHIWFQRGEAKDRVAVAKRLQEHVEDPDKLPILIFPEGTCINNTSIMMFKKGSFEVGGIIYPVAIKYDPRFADPFWNSGKQSLSKHLLLILTSWAIVCDVWYLPPEKQRDGEDGLTFANRIKADIAKRGGLVDLEWDGGLKRSTPKASYRQQVQEEYSKRIKFE